MAPLLFLEHRCRQTGVNLPSYMDFRQDLYITRGLSWIIDHGEHYEAEASTPSTSEIDAPTIRVV
jgi:hypothetical protein